MTAQNALFANESHERLALNRLFARELRLNNRLRTRYSLARRAEGLCSLAVGFTAGSRVAHSDQPQRAIRERGGGIVQCSAPPLLARQHISTTAEG